MAIESVTFQTTTIASPPSGTAVAVDTIGGNEFQVVKIALGADGAFDTLVDSGQQTMANSLPVAIASNQSNVPISIEADNVGIGGGTEYTEDAAAPANPVGKAVALVRQDTPATLVSADGDIVAQRATNYGAAFVQILDSSGNFVDSFGGGTQYAVDAALGATPTGTVAIAKRDDALTTLTPVEGDAIELRVDANGALWTHDNVLAAALSGSELQVDIVAALPAGDNAIGRVKLTDGTEVANVNTNNRLEISIEEDNVGIGGGTQYAVDTALGATPTGTLAIAIRDDALSALTPVEGDAIGLRVDANGALWVIPSGTVTIQEAAALDVSAATVTVANGGTFAVQEDGAALTALQLIDDIVATDDTSTHATGTTKGAVMMAAATPADGSVDANDLGALAMSTDRRLLVDAQIAGQDADITIADGGNAITVDAANDGSLNVTVGDGTNTATIRDLAANDALNVAIVDGAGDQITSFGGGTEYAVDDALGATPTGTLALAIRDDALSALTPVEGDAIGLRVDANGALWTIPSGTVTVQEASALDVSAATVTVTDNGSFTLAANSGVDIGDVDVLTIPGTAGEGAALPSVFVVVAGDDGTDTHPLQTATDGDLKVTLDSEVVTVDLGANNDVVAAGDVAHDSADSGNPVKVGGVAYNFDGSAPGTAVAEGDRAEFPTDVYGRQFVETAHPNFWTASADYASAQTNTSVKAAPGAGLRLYITDVMISNGATAGNITLLDGSGGTVLIEIYPAANGGLSTNFRTPIALTANTALVITSTTVTTHSVTINGYIAP